VTETPGLNPRPEPSPHSKCAEVEQFCRDIVRNMRLELEVSATEQGETVVVNFTGHDRGFLLSGGASLLNSIEYLANRVFRSLRSETPAVMLDSDHYRQHREAELVLLAQMASKKVMEQKRALTLQPMIPRERRIVHLALAQIEGVRSESQGDGEDRSITIYPL
jgi:spoIIIJ-associated protein